MRFLSALMLLGLMVVMPVTAQDDEKGCSVNPDAFLPLLDELASTDAEDVEAIEEILLNIRLESITQQVSCYDLPDVGLTRLDPIPLGEAADYEFGDWIGIVRLISLRNIDTDDYRYLTDDERYIEALFEFECTMNAVSTCLINSSQNFILVGSTGRVYEPEYIVGVDSDMTLFGGGRTTYPVIFSVPEGEDNFVVAFGGSDIIRWFGGE